jgi:type IV pilus assembly protein PilB
LEVINRINYRFSSLIVRKGLLKKREIEGYIEAANTKNERIDVYLADNGILTEEQIFQIGMAYFGYQSINIDKIDYDEKIVSEVTDEFIDAHHLLPLKKEGDLYVVAITDVFDYQAVQTAKALFGHDIIFVFTVPNKVKGISALVHSKYRVQEAISSYTLTRDDANGGLMNDVSTAPAVRLVESILKEAIAAKASDIHIEPYDSIVRVRNRIDGVLYEASNFDISIYQSIVTRLKIVGGLNITERRIPQDGRFSLKVSDELYDFRLSTLPTVHGEKIVIRILDTSAFSFNLKELGFTDEAIETVTPILRRPHGIILLTGPTGCGKSTTLYSFIREINSVESNIVSVEDPVEYTIEGINQVQVNNKVDMTFAKALRSILRQDPNIIMIGEIRDEETAHIAIRAAITGHLVFSTLHTNDAPGAIIRLTDMGVEPYLVSDALEMVIAQRLIRKLCPECKKRVKANKAQMEVLGLKTDSYIYEPVGCPACHGTGYKGRTGIHEILIMDDNLRGFVSQRESPDVINKYLADNPNFINIHKALIESIKKGVTSYSELFNVSVEE